MRTDRLPSHALAFSPAVQSAASKTGIPEEVIWALMATESAFNPLARSPVGAIGLMQLMPATARELRADPFDTSENIGAGAEYLKRMLVRYKGSLARALAAYNWGPGHLGLPAKPPGAWPKETQQHVARVARNLARFMGA